MPHDFSDLFAELGEAKAQLQRSSRKARTHLQDRRAALEARSQWEGDRPLFGWPDPQDP